MISGNSANDHLSTSMVCSGDWFDGNSCDGGVAHNDVTKGHRRPDSPTEAANAEPATCAIDIANGGSFHRVANYHRRVAQVVRRLTCKPSEVERQIFDTQIFFVVSPSVPGSDGPFSGVCPKNVLLDPERHHQPTQTRGVATDFEEVCIG